MRTIGMIGGLGPESTADYYRRMIAQYRERTTGGSYPRILIDSLDMTAVLRLVEEEDWDTLIRCLSNAAKALHRAGADFAFIASNTPHVVFQEVSQRSPIPLISIVETTCAEAQRLGLRRVGLMGTAFTMEHDYYRRVFSRYGIEVAVPGKTDRQYIQTKLNEEIELGVFLDATRRGLLKIAAKLETEQAAQGIILGCTELPLILTANGLGVPFLNTTALHVKRVIDACLQE